MKILVAGSVFALASAACLAAHSGQSAPVVFEGPPEPRRVKAAGCLQVGSQPGTFFLPDIRIDLKIRGADGKVRSKSVTYEIVPESAEASDVSGLVGRRVEVEGDLELGSRSVAADTASVRNIGRALRGADIIEIQRLHLTGIQPLRGSCNQSGTQN